MYGNQSGDLNVDIGAYVTMRARYFPTLSFKKPTVRTTSGFLGLDETWVSSGRSPITITLVRSCSQLRKTNS